MEFFTLEQIYQHTPIQMMESIDHMSKHYSRFCISCGDDALEDHCIKNSLHQIDNITVKCCRDPICHNVVMHIIDYIDGTVSFLNNTNLITTKISNGWCPIFIWLDTLKVYCQKNNKHIYVEIEDIIKMNPGYKIDLRNEPEPIKNKLRRIPETSGFFSLFII